jgi:hypothetical protein
MPDARELMGEVCIMGVFTTGTGTVSSNSSQDVFGVGRKASQAKIASQTTRRLNRLRTNINCGIVNVFGMSTRASSFRPFLTENSVLLS